MKFIKAIAELFNSPSKFLPKNISVLFILRKRDDNWGATNPYSYHSSGLINSATFVCDMLNENGIKADLVQVVDSNDIDREVFKFNPDIVILEAIWCPPAKVRELVGLYRHRNRKWIVRNHSELPFLSMEGISMEWLLDYARIPNTYVSCNSPTANHEVAELLRIKDSLPESSVPLLPNYYPVPRKIRNKIPSTKGAIDVGCFGAIRPLKNHLEQAVAAIIFARTLNRPLRFHINATRIEGRADPILRSVRSLFKHIPGYELVEHPWMDREEFLNLCKRMDIGIQVSFSETFNIVGADLVSQGVPVVTSDEVPWTPSLFHALPTSAYDIAVKMQLAFEIGADPQIVSLRKYSQDAKRVWLRQLDRLSHLP